jgi:hypothetical protein
VKGDNVTLELDTNKRTLHLFVNNVIQPLRITNIPLPCCFIIVSVGRVDKIEFKSLQDSYDPTCSVDFIDEDKNEDEHEHEHELLLLALIFNKFLFSTTLYSSLCLFLLVLKRLSIFSPTLCLITGSFLLTSSLKMLYWIIDLLLSI